MKTRLRSLPAGWYPDTREAVLEAIARLGKNIKPKRISVAGGVVPHAGWEFSGKAALEVFLSAGTAGLDNGDIETCVVVGGHLHPDSGILVAHEDAYDTPLGDIPVDRDLLGLLEKELHLTPDLYQDNTVEIQLPLVKHCFPKARLLWLRASPSQDAILLGKALFRSARHLGRKTLVFGSTDLTHYGSNYGFSPMGSGRSGTSVNKALEWVKNVNDKTVIDAICGLDPVHAISHALADLSACSIGGAAAAISYAKEMGAQRGELLSYYTSHDIYPMGDSFVGYAGIIFPLPA
jgi:AmmeMemoRadiSam system protein B